LIVATCFRRIAIKKNGRWRWFGPAIGPGPRDRLQGMCLAARRLNPDAELIVVGMLGPHNMSQADLVGVSYGTIAFERIPFVS
jgi:hypothetical protein